MTPLQCNGMAAARLLKEWDDLLLCYCGNEATNVALFFRGWVIMAIPRCNGWQHDAGHVLAFNAAKHGRLRTGNLGVVVEADRLLVQEAHDFLTFMRKLLRARDSYQRRTNGPEWSKAS